MVRASWLLLVALLLGRAASQMVRAAHSLIHTSAR